MHTIAQNDTIFQLNMAKNVTQDFGKYNNAKFFCHVYYSDLGDQPLF